MKTYFIAILVLVCSTAAAQVRVGGMAPEISLPNVKDSVINLSSFKGKVVLIDFWASWCGPCRAANPKVARLYKKFKDKGFEVFGVSIDESKNAWTKAIRQDRIKYVQVNDNAGLDSKVTFKYSVEAIPTSFLLDRTGKIIAIDLEGKELENKISELLQ